MALFTIKARSNGSNIVGPVWTLRSNMLDGLGWSLTLFKVFNQHSLTFSLAGSKSWPAWYIPKSNIAGWCWIRLNTPAFNTDQTSSNTTQQCWIMFEQYVWFVSTGLYCSRGDVGQIVTLGGFILRNNSNCFQHYQHKMFVPDLVGWLTHKL